MVRLIYCCSIVLLLLSGTLMAEADVGRVVSEESTADKVELGAVSVKVSQAECSDQASVSTRRTVPGSGLFGFLRSILNDWFGLDVGEEDSDRPVLHKGTSYNLKHQSVARDSGWSDEIT